MILRLIEPLILNSLEKHQKIHLIYGPRQAGKTTLLLSIKTKIEQKGLPTLYLNCDLEENRQAINTTALTSLNQLLQNTKILLIDEAQRLDNPGLTLKIIHDNLPQVKVVATGSSSFQLKNSLSDALTGRYLNFTLFPLSFSEITNFQALSTNQALRKQQTDTMLPSLLLFGFYPEVYLHGSPTDKQLFLN